VFIANAPGENLPSFLRGPDRIYNEFYAAMKSWGRYELVLAPAAADLIFEISFTSSITQVTGTSTTGCSSSSEAALRLVIVDPKAHVPLWWLEQNVQEALREKTQDKYFDQATANLLESLKKLVGSSTATADSTNQ
jgi:hypothetical protein